MAAARARRAVARAQQPADHHLRGDRQRVEQEREEDEELEGDLVRGERGGADAGEHGRGDQERAEQGAGAHRDLGPDADQRAHAGQQRRLEPGAALHLHEGEAHAGLGDHRAPRRAGEAPAEAVDEQHLEHHVDRVRGDEDDQRRAQVADAAQEALAGGGDHEERRADRGDPQVQHGAVGDLVLAAHQPHGAGRQHEGGDEQHEAEEERQPERLRAEEGGLAVAAGAVQAGDLRGGAVGEEVEDREAGREHRRRDRQRGELRRAQVADDRRVDQHVERLGRERAQRRDGEGEDFAVERLQAHIVSRSL